jgi:hypothetical protein
MLACSRGRWGERGRARGSRMLVRKLSTATPPGCRTRQLAIRRDRRRTEHAGSDDGVNAPSRTAAQMSPARPVAKAGRRRRFDHRLRQIEARDRPATAVELGTEVAGAHARIEHVPAVSLEQLEGGRHPPAKDLPADAGAAVRPVVVGGDVVEEALDLSGRAVRRGHLRRSAASSSRRRTISSAEAFGHEHRRRRSACAASSARYERAVAASASAGA